MSTRTVVTQHGFEALLTEAACENRGSDGKEVVLECNRDGGADGDEEEPATSQICSTTCRNILKRTRAHCDRQPS